MTGPFIRNRKLQMLLVAMGTAVAGEFKINPFDGDIFRIALGSSAFLLFLLLLRHLPCLKTGILTGIVVLLFRVALDTIWPHHHPVLQSFCNHLSAGVYYVAFGAGLQYVRRLDHVHPLLLGGAAACIDFISNEAELLTRMLVLGTSSFHLNEWTYLSFIAVLRTYFTTGLYSSIAVSRMRAVQAEQKRRVDQMLSFGAGLYGEVFYLRKSVHTVERLTAASYELYQRLKDSGQQDYSRRLLDITQQIHEVKKDSQRILAGLLKLSEMDSADADMPLPRLMDFLVKSNSEYASMLGKDVTFRQDVSPEYRTPRYIPLLTLLNNLVANAVEAIEHKGVIMLQVYEAGGRTVFVVQDNGRGINERDHEIVFEPGFTTKFDEEGSAATGIGLSHVRDITVSLGGSILVRTPSKGKGTVFEVSIPTISLKRGE
ncbi:sensor histidine kinase [Paenibacillus caui]|uniref:sensor histidine kinase n=1 Tax=Paenibacillus caui TaxID=2873927 RepID=UPI001CA804FA|nr:ATP-binding protein [Paenibacillus caui]